MAGPDPAELRRVVDAFPGTPDGGVVDRVNDLLDGTYGRLTREWYPELVGVTEAYRDGDVLREDVLEHVEAVPSFRLSDGAAPLPAKRRALFAADEAADEVTEIAGWYATLRSLVDDDPGDLTRLERLLHGFGYVFAHGLFLGASSPERVVRRLRLAYRSVGVDNDDAATEAGAERTTFTCPYRNVGARIYGEKWVCHEKLDRVDDGYVTYLAERGIDYQRPRGCDGSEQCYSTVARDGPEPWWPKTAPDEIRARP
ncbi:hypothetical protein [Halorubrum lipolyticum]|uniref:Uncharacterized protein n=1 Tax=Halorubrum lipolyticum DSM 21995 TaxID=1227482 RepID=M0P730_9EURY|nr:hypothetical protein [Halorubrum lipolyticum]EMA64645.1 hypothetical protein C469_00275 [Halorubrum lipolyticum DSM 21995]